MPDVPGQAPGALSRAGTVRRLQPDDAPALVSLRREALESEPLAFASSVEDDRLTLDSARTMLAADQEQAIFGLFPGADLAGMRCEAQPQASRANPMSGGARDLAGMGCEAQQQASRANPITRRASQLVGMIGVVRGSRVKQRHRGIIWGMYVAPRARGRGLGRALLEAAIGHARQWPGVEQLHLSVSDTGVAAKHLYETAGFRSWGREPRSLQWNGQYVDDYQMVLDLRDPA